jgi:hypothetical protein
MLEVKLYDLGYCKDEELTRVICVSKYKDNYVFSYNKKREGWEIPGGHIEEGETWEEAALSTYMADAGSGDCQHSCIGICVCKRYGKWYAGIHGVCFVILYLVCCHSMVCCSASKEIPPDEAEAPG